MTKRTTTSASIGTAIVVYSDPHRGSEARYNRWYEDDHVYSAAMAGPGVMAHGRWVAPAAYKALRPQEATLLGDPARGSYLLTFWVLEGMQQDWNEWIRGQEKVLAAEDRWRFPPDDAKDHLYTAVYRFLWESRAESGPLAVVALDRGFPGIIAVAIERTPDCDLTAIRQWTDALIRPQVPVCVALEPAQLFKSVLKEHPDPADHGFVLVLAFCDADPAEVWKQHIEPALAEVRKAPGVRGVGFASPFMRTVPGTDRYIDDLWLQG